MTARGNRATLGDMSTPRSAFPATFTYATVTFLLVIAAFAFTWYSLRPTFFVGFCNDSAGVAARHLLKTKAGVMGDPAGEHQHSVPTSCSFRTLELEPLTPEACRRPVVEATYVS